MIGRVSPTDFIAVSSFLSVPWHCFLSPSGEGDAAPGGGDAEDDEENFAIDDDEELPFACHICREDFKAPVVTVCGHYFCGQCIIGSSKKHTKCPICDKQTFGVFNV